jgi:NTP pyrophosphatase (non-canonical NTP hydrolase)
MSNSDKQMSLDMFHANRHAETLEGLLERYAALHRKLEVTPHHMPEVNYRAQRLLHGAIGLSTESAEVLDALKKHLYGKRAGINSHVLDELCKECGDVFFYLWLVMDVLGYSFKQMLNDNMDKLSARYNIVAERNEDE